MVLTGSFRHTAKIINDEIFLVLEVLEDMGSYETCIDHFQDGWRSNFVWRPAKVEDLDLLKGFKARK